MIDLKQRDERTPNALIVAAVLILAGTLIYLLAVPEPSTLTARAGSAFIGRNLAEETRQAESREKLVLAAIEPRVWHGDDDTVTAAVLSRMTSLAQSNSLRLVSFRPDREQQVSGLTELRFTAEVSGQYAQVRDVMAALDAAGGRIALRSIDLATTTESGSAGNDSGLPPVSATLGLSAYVPDDTLPKPSLRMKTKAGATSHLHPAQRPIKGNENSGDSGSPPFREGLGVGSGRPDSKGVPHG
ncbi:MAG: GspMb/PilO family protein [Capsulimonadaceae bacterium]